MSQVPGPAISAPDVAYEWVKNFIAALPREEEAFLNEGVLASETGTSRTPVREALLRLEAEGFVKRIPHKGAYVPPIGDAQVGAVLEARAVVEKWAASQVIHKPNEISNLRKLFDEQSAIRADDAAFIKADTQFHTHLVRAGGNPVLTDFYASLREHQLRMGLRAVSDPDRVDKVLAEHQLIIDLLADGDHQGASAAIDDHLESTRKAIIGPR